MITNKYIFSLLALLFAGSVGVTAQSDPFGEVEFGAYANNMSLIGYVRLGYEILGEDAIVAVYCGDELRGKASPVNEERYENILYLDIYGDSSGDNLIFKVFTGGKIYVADQGLTYKGDAVVGSPQAPYYIDVFPADFSDATVVTTTNADGLATTCLPYNATIPEGAKAYTATGIADNELQLALYTDDILPAYTPVIISGAPKSTFEWEPVVTIVKQLTGNILSGTTAAMAVEAGTVLTLGYDNGKENGKIGFWNFMGTTIHAHSAYITADQLPAEVQGLTFTSDFVVVGIDAVQSTHDCEIYNLAGQRLYHKQRGINIIRPTHSSASHLKNSRKIFVK